MAQPQWRDIRANFGGSAQKGIAGFTSGVGGIQDRLAAEAREKARLEQQTVANTRAEALLGIQQAQEGRAADTYQAKLASDKAITDTAANTMDETLARSISAAYEANPEEFTKAYGSDLSPTQQALYAKDPSGFNRLDSGPLDQSASSKTLSDAVIAAGQNTDIINTQDYTKRLAENAIRAGASPATAIANAKAYASLQQTAGPNKEVSKARFDIAKELIDNKIDTLDKQLVAAKKSSKGAGKGKGSYGNNASGFSKLVMDLKSNFPNTDWGPNALGGGDLIAKAKELADKGVIHPDDFFAAAMLNSSGAEESWTAKDSEVQLKGFEDTLAKLAAKRAGGGKSYDGLKAIQSEFAAKRDQLITQKGKAGERYLATFGTTGGATGNEGALASKVISDFYGKAGKEGARVSTKIDKFDIPSTSVTTGTVQGGTPTITPKVNQASIFKPGSPEHAAQIEAIKKASGGTAIPVNKFDTVRDKATANFKAAENANISPFERGVTQLGNRLLYGAAGLGEGTQAVGGFISDALTGLDNAGTAVGNFFRSSPKEYMTTDEGRAFFTGDSTQQKAARTRAKESLSKPDAKILDVMVADGENATRVALKEQYPKLSNDAIDTKMRELLEKAGLVTTPNPSISNIR